VQWYQLGLGDDESGVSQAAVRLSTLILHASDPITLPTEVSDDIKADCLLEPLEIITTTGDLSSTNPPGIFQTDVMSQDCLSAFAFGSASTSDPINNNRKGPSATCMNTGLVDYCLLIGVY
jgi:hypothetical protein